MSSPCTEDALAVNSTLNGAQPSTKRMGWGLGSGAKWNPAVIVLLTVSEPSSPDAIRVRRKVSGTSPLCASTVMIGAFGVAMEMVTAGELANQFHFLTGPVLRSRTIKWVEAVKETQAGLTINRVLKSATICASASCGIEIDAPRRSIKVSNRVMVVFVF